MLQSEFFERTKVNLEPQEYIKVETLYSEVKMDKDEFCKQWLKLRDNPLMKEAIDAFFESQQMVYEIARLKGQLEKKKTEYEERLSRQTKNSDKHFREFAESVLLANETDGDLRVYEVIEQEFGTPFIIKTKREARISLTEEEIDYMVRLCC